VNGDTRVNNADLTWSSNILATVGLTFFFPPTPEVTE